MSYTHGAGDTLFSAIEHVINKALRAPDVPEKLAAQGADVGGGAPNALAAALKTDLPRMGKIVKAAKIKP